MQVEHVTIDIVSKKAGVSKTTVSRYLNGKFEHMSKKTRDRIKGVIEELNYRPNAVARSLKSKRSGLIGVIVSDISNPISVSLIKGVIDYCTTEGFQVLTASSDECKKKEREYLLSMVDRQVEGIVVNVVDFKGSETLDSLMSQGVNIVLADRIVESGLFDTVTTDNYDATRSAIKFLYNEGFEVVGYFSSDLLLSSVRKIRLKAFMDESIDHGSDPERLVYILPDDNEEECQRALVEFILQNRGKHLAVFASTPMALLSLLGAAQSLNLRVPRELGICGYDNLGWTKLIDGGISVVEQPFYDVGKESAKILINRIRNGMPEDEDKMYVELKSTLILRNSTKIPEVSDEQHV